MDGTNMPQLSTASYTEAEARAWADSVRDDSANLHAAVQALMDAQPLNTKAKAVRDAKNALCARLTDLHADALGRLGPTVSGPLYSGGTQKT